MTKELVLERPVGADITVDLYKLVLHNDEVNSFDWVIESLIKVCEHTVEQAEQCAWIVHLKGKYAVKSGEFSVLEPFAHALMRRGLSVTID